MQDHSVEVGCIFRRIPWITSGIRCLGDKSLTVKLLGHYMNPSGSDMSS
jgi:hypothetical protein